MMIKTAISYARQSTTFQQSIPAQISELEDYANQHDMRIIATFQDAMSGKDTNRDGFNDMTDFLSTHDVNFILVWRYDRIARNLKDLEAFLKMCSESNTYVISINEQLGTHGAQNTMMLQVLGALGQYQREIIKENQQIAYHQKYREGKILSANVSYGYRLVDDKLIIREDEAQIVKDIFDLYVNKNIGYKAIAEHLNRSERFNRKSKWWHPTRIKAILDNPFYTGKVLSKYGNNNTHALPIIGLDVFNKVKEIQQRRQVDNQRVTRRYVLQGKIRCPYCQSICSPSHSISCGRDYYYYTCSLHISGGKQHCPGIFLNALETEASISNKLYSFIQSDYLTTQLKAYINQANKEIDTKNQISQKQLKERQNKLLRAYEKNMISDEELSSQLTSLNQRIKSQRLKPRIPETIYSLLDLNLIIDPTPTVGQYTLYQSIIDWVEVDEEKNITAIYLKEYNENILKGAI